MAYRRNRNYVDPDNFTDYLGAKDLLGNSFRSGFDYDAYGDNYEFSVVVLTQPIPMATQDVGAFFGSYQDPTSTTSIGNIRFQGRILGGAFKSLHEPLPNPCNIRANGDPATAAKIAAMHTTFISSEGFVGKAPSIGDIVKVTMNPGDFKYSTQYAQFKKIQKSTDASDRAAAQALGCQNLAGLFEDFDYNTDLGDISIEFGPSEEPLSDTERYLDGQVGPKIGGLPVKAVRMTSPFGMRRDPVAGRSSNGLRMHNGIDFGGSQGTNMYPPFEGTVGRVVDPNAGSADQAPWIFGRVEIEHANGEKSVFLHCSEILVKTGDAVTNGTIVAKMGGTPGTPGCGGKNGKYWSTGPHLHYEYRVNGTAVNPYTYLRWGEVLSNGRTGNIAHWQVSRGASSHNNAEGELDEEAALELLGMLR